MSPNGALHAFQVHTWSLLNPWSGELKHSQKLSTLLAHLARSLDDGFDKQACYNEFRGFTLAVGSAVWSRLQLKYWSWPFFVLRGIQPVAPTADAAAVLHEFWEAPACCLDSAWGLWFRASLSSEDELSSMDVQMWLREIERKAPSTNMLLEGLLAEVKAACPRPTASSANQGREVFVFWCVGTADAQASESGEPRRPINNLHRCETSRCAIGHSQVRKHAHTIWPSRRRLCDDKAAHFYEGQPECDCGATGCRTIKALCRMGRTWPRATTSICRDKGWHSRS